LAFGQHGFVLNGRVPIHIIDGGVLWETESFAVAFCCVELSGADSK